MAFGSVVTKLTLGGFFTLSFSDRIYICSGAFMPIR